jgi:hypothetical protein
MAETFFQESLIVKKQKRLKNPGRIFQAPLPCGLLCQIGRTILEKQDYGKLPLINYR